MFASIFIFRELIDASPTAGTQLVQRQKVIMISTAEFWLLISEIVFSLKREGPEGIQSGIIRIFHTNDMSMKIPYYIV